MTSLSVFGLTDWLCLTAGVFLVWPEGGVVTLELLPSASQVLLEPNSNFSVVRNPFLSVLVLLR